jgi:dipeptidyl aminopeptidase/acylaminoacyl peptidase
MTTFRTSARIAILLALPQVLSAQGRAFTPNDWYRVTTLSSPALSPDGQRVAFTVTTVVTAENKRHSEIWVVGAEGGNPVRYTSPSVESSQPRWSPDGRLLLFNSTRPGSKGRVYALRMDQPGGEAFEYDSIPGASLSADRRTMAWGEGAPEDTAKRPNDPYEKMRADSRPPFGAITKPLDPARFDGRQYVDWPIKGNGQGFLANRRDARLWRPAQVWVQTLGDARDSRPYLITRRKVTDTRYSHRSVSISPDGQWIAFSADSKLRPDSVVTAEADSIARLPYDAKRDEAPRNDTDLFVIAASGGEPRRLTTTQGNDDGIGWSPDGKTIYFVNQAKTNANQRLMRIGVQGGAPEALTPGWQYEHDAYAVLPDGSLLVSAQIGGRGAFFRVDPATKRMTEIIGGRRRLAGWSGDAAGRKIAFVASSMSRPTELFIANSDGTGERQLTTFNDALNKEVAWSDAERFTYKSVGNVEIEGWLMKPYGYESGKKYPVVLYIHGGPHSLYGENWFDEFQSLAGAGFMVLFTNPRGSGGYGADFTYSTRGRWFAEDYEDLMRGVDLVAKRPDVDSTRMGVSGGSYGGVMTAWITVKTNRFKAAQADRMISNFWSWYGSSDAQGLTEYEFFGKPWDNPAMYDSLSPIRYLRKVKTPTFIVQSEEDHRTPITDGEQWFIGLKKQGTPTEFVRYPRSTHDLSRTGEPWLLVDRLNRIRQWFTYWLVEKGSPVAN